MDAWRGAGLTDPESDLLGGPFPSYGLVVSEQVELDREHDLLGWNPMPGRLIATPTDLLTRFLALGVDGEGRPCEPTGAEILAFAKRFGPLDAWPPTSAWPMWERLFCEMKEELPDGFSMAEPLEFWRHYTAAMRAVLDIMALVRENKTPPPAAWEPLAWKPPGRPLIPNLQEDASYLPNPSHRVCWIINTWIEQGGVRPRILPGPAATGGEMRPVLHAFSMFGVLGVQLLQTVSSTGGWAFCRSCGAPFAVRVGGLGRRTTYCDRCGPKARRRLAARRHYYKKQEEARERENAHGQTSHEKASSRKPRR